MLITDEIRSKTILAFSEPLSAEQNKHFQELFALAVLRYFEPNRFGEYVKVDAPDLQCKSTMSGVEVTIATLNMEAAVKGDYVTFRQEKDNSRRKALERKIVKRGGKVDEYGISYPVKTLDMEKSAIYDAIIRKNKKLNNYRNSGYVELSLFVLYEDPLLPTWTAEKLKQLFEDTKGMPSYDTIYLCSSNVLFTYRYADKELKIYSMPREDSEALGAIVRMTVDGEIDINSPIWTACKEK